MSKFAKAIIVAGFAAFAAISANAQTFEWISDNVDVYDLQVISVKQGKLTANISGVGRRTFRVPPEFRFHIDGVPTRLSGLVPRQKLRAYVTRTPRGNLQLVDAGPVRTEVPAIPPKTPIVAPPAEQVVALPKTGSFLPLSLALAGISAGLALAVRRRRLS